MVVVAVVVAVGDGVGVVVVVGVGVGVAVVVAVAVVVGVVVAVGVAVAVAVAVAVVVAVVVAVAVAVGVVVKQGLSGLGPEGGRDPVKTVDSGRTGDLFDRQPVAPYQATSDTSRAAAASISRKQLGRECRAVLQALARQDTYGLTDEQIATATALPGNSVRPRRGELVAAGYVHDLGVRRKTASGRRAVVWFLTRDGREALR